MRDWTQWFVFKTPRNHQWASICWRSNFLVNIALNLKDGPRKKEVVWEESLLFYNHRHNSLCSVIVLLGSFSQWEWVGDVCQETKRPRKIINNATFSQEGGNWAMHLYLWGKDKISWRSLRPGEIHNSSLQIVRHSTEAWIIWQCFGLNFYLKCIKSIIVFSYVNLKPCYKDCSRLKKALRTVCNYQLWLKRVEFRRARDPF